jgi:hypothetical protein
MCLNLIKTIYSKSKANIIPSEGKPESVLSNILSKTRIPDFTYFIQQSMIHHLTQVRMIIMKKNGITSSGDDVKKREPLHVLLGNVN